jgi:hypothetical protein
MIYLRKTLSLFLRLSLLVLIGWGVVSCGSGGDSPTSISPSNPIDSGSGTFAIQVRFIGNTFSPSQQSLFLAAAQQWAEIITQDIPNIRLNIPAGECLSGSPAINQEVDDLLIDARGSDIDGNGGTLGSAGPCFFREESLLPVYGIMDFDRADVARLEAEGQLDRVILHEMGHVLGIGTLWLDKNLLSGVLSLNPVYLGTGGRTQYAVLGGSGSVPVENRGSVGTRADHWRESIFDEELMTGFLDAGVFNPLSRLTIGSLTDLGYQVNLSAAEPYSLDGRLRRGSQQRSPLAQALPLREGNLTAPRVVVNREGKEVYRIRFDTHL